MGSGRDERPYFFLSYARTPKRDPSDRDDPDRWVYRLYKDLCSAILQMTDARHEEAGFMDRENNIGSQWSPALTTALAGCRVFVPLSSRRYFESDNCGREWFAFARREITRKARVERLSTPSCRPSGPGSTARNCLMLRSPSNSTTRCWVSVTAPRASTES